jgi:phospholipid/cholesterol/gamma-HCH transport system substrate-binding protein
MRRLWMLGLLVAALTLTACAGNEERQLQALFDDVVDLVNNGHVKIADVPVGVIKSIELTEDEQALVTMEITRDLELPSEVSARLRKTNLLGERFVELVPDRESGGEFEWGSTITDTQTIPEFEQFISSSTEILAAVSADRIAGALEAGATGLGGRGQTFGQLLDDMTEIVSSYDRNSQDLVRLIDGMEAFLADVGPEAELHGRALAELQKATAVLREEDERLLDTLQDVRGLSETSVDIMQTHRERIDRFWTHFGGLVGEIERRNADLAAFGALWDQHNRNTYNGVNQEHAQIFFDFIVCGVNDRPGDPVRACHKPPQGGDRPPIREPQP